MTQRIQPTTRYHQDDHNNRLNTLFLRPIMGETSILQQCKGCNSIISRRNRTNPTPTAISTSTRRRNPQRTSNIAQSIQYVPEAPAANVAAITTAVNFMVSSKVWVIGATEIDSALNHSTLNQSKSTKCEVRHNRNGVCRADEAWMIMTAICT